MTQLLITLSLNFLSYSHNLEHSNTLNIAINTARLMKHVILINFNIEIQFVTFRRGAPGTPIDPALVLPGMHCSTS